MGYRIVSIKNTEHKDLELYTDFSENQLFHIFEPEEGVFVAESDKVIKRAIDAGYEPISFMIEEKYLEENAYLYENFDVPVFTGTADELKALVGYNLPKGILAIFRRKPQMSIKDMTDGISRIAILEDVENPTNVGAIFRAAAALGIELVVLTYESCDPLYRRSARVSMGTVFQVPWLKLFRKKGESLEQVLESLKNEGFKLAGMALNNRTISLDEAGFEKEPKLAVILGNEDRGMTQKTMDLCDVLVKIPMSGGVDSLNVSAASAVAFWAMRRKTNGKED